MRIRYKFFIAFIIVIAITIPVPVYILNSRIDELRSNILASATMQAKQISHAVLSMLLVNSGNVAQTSIDAIEYIHSITPYFTSGLVSLQVILITPNPKYNRMLLVDIPGGKTLTQIPEEQFTTIHQNESDTPSIKDNNLIQFTARSVLPKTSIACITSTTYTTSVMLKPVYSNYMVLVISVFSILIIAYITALVFSYRFSKPVELIISALKQFDEGTTLVTIPDIPQKDEIGKLARTTQHLLDMVNLEIKELTKTNMELLRLNKLKDDFLANIAYEIKMPLESITHVLNSTIHSILTGSRENITNTLEMIAHSSLRLSYIIDDILDFTRLKNNDITLSKKVVDIAGVINFVLSILQPAINTKGIPVDVCVNQDSRFVLADEQRLQQMLLNIINNAVTYWQKGSIYIATYRDNVETITIQIKDSSAGIPEKLLKNIDEFGYTPVSTSSGIGLGLFITKKLMELHGGRMAIQSVANEGTVVLLSFPFDEAIVTKELSALTVYAKQPKETYPATRYINYESNAKSYSGFIYIVDDDPVNVKILYDMLHKANFYVEYSHDDTYLYTLLNQGKLPDCILLDTILPGTSAFEVCEKLRKQYSLYELPVIVITPKHRTQEIVTAFRIGANDYISKPFNEDELIARISNCVSLKKSIEEHNEYVMLKHEIRLAHEIHNSVIIKDIPPVNNINIAHVYIPTREMGGDFYDVIPIDSEKTGIMIADVTGHGIPAALVCAMVKMAMTNNIEFASNPSALLTRLNKDLSNAIRENYITAAYALIDSAGKTVTVASAGHWPPILIQTNGATFDKWPKDFPIGWVDDIMYHESQSTYSSGDKLLLYTDGIIEAMNTQNKIFGPERLAEYINHNYNNNPDIFIKGLIGTLHTWCEINQDDTFNDDVTIIMAELL